VKAETSRRDRRDSRWDEHRRARREQLVDATIAAVGRHGAGVGMEEIAAAAGTSKTVVYRHFADRTELHVAVCARVAAYLTARLREAMDSAGDPRQMVAAAVETYLAFLEADPELYRFVVQGPPTDGRPAGPLTQTRSPTSPTSSATRRPRWSPSPWSRPAATPPPRSRGATAWSAWSARPPTGGCRPTARCPGRNSPRTSPISPGPDSPAS
jgi:AcrR family transcriptional regulator